MEKIQANKVHGYRLNYFTAADFAHQRFADIEVVPSPPLPRQISGESVVYYLIIPAQGHFKLFDWIHSACRCCFLSFRI